MTRPIAGSLLAKKMPQRAFTLAEAYLPTAALPAYGLRLKVRYVVRSPGYLLYSVTVYVYGMRTTSSPVPTTGLKVST